MLLRLLLIVSLLTNAASPWTMAGAHASPADAAAADVHAGHAVHASMDDTMDEADARHAHAGHAQHAHEGSTPADHAGDCCNGPSCDCGCLLPNALVLPARATFAFAPASMPSSPSVHWQVDGAAAPPMRPPIV